MRLPQLPAARETVTGGNCQFCLGGKGANQAVAAKRAGGEVVFISAIGNDAIGGQVQTALAAEGIGSEGLLTLENTETGKAMIFVDQHGENCIGVADGANGQFSAHLLAPYQATIAAADYLILQLEIPMGTVEAAAAIAQIENTQVILNPAPAAILSDSLLAKTGILTPNQIEIAQICGFAVNNKADLAKAAHYLFDKGVTTLLVTLGNEGVFIATAQNSEILSAFKVTAVDTTAAGDVFNGNLAVALSTGATIKEAAQFASAAAALSVTKAGAIPSIPYQQEIECFLSSRNHL